MQHEPKDVQELKIRCELGLRQKDFASEKVNFKEIKRNIIEMSSDTPKHVHAIRKINQLEFPP
jgi:hypothetical protein